MQVQLQHQISKYKTSEQAVVLDTLGMRTGWKMHFYRGEPRNIQFVI